MTPRMRRTLATAPVAVVLLAGCAAVVDGSGSTGVSAGSSAGSSPTSGASGFPSVTSPAPSVSAGSAAPSSSASGVPSLAPAALTCPTAVFPAAGLSSRCITDPMEVDSTASLAPSVLVRTVEPATGWRIEMGAGPYPSASSSLSAAAKAIRDRFVSSGAYGTRPTASTATSGTATVSGRPCFVLGVTVRINPAWAKQRGTRVAVERLAIVTIERSPRDIVF